MALIRLEAVPNQGAVLCSTTGKPTLEVEGQHIVYAVRVPKTNRGQTLLATGETLESLQGDVTLYRGKLQMEGGQRYPDTITYVAANEGIYGVPPGTPGYSVSLFVDERLFDQVVSLSRASKLPRLNLDFDSVRGTAITFGDAPDGSERIWNNKDHPTAHIAGATIVIPLADHPETVVDDQQPTSPDPDMVPPTMAQLDRRFAESNKALAQLRRAVSSLTLAVFAIAAILVLVRLF